MYKYLGHWITAIIDGFYLLRSDVLSLCQLENVLLSVDDLQAAILTRVEEKLNLKQNQHLML